MLAPVVAAALWVLATWLLWRMRAQAPGRTAIVVVLGDVGRSPRMCYHVRSLIEAGWSVSIAGYFESRLPADLDQAVHRLPLYTPPKMLQSLPRALFAVVALIKVPLQAVTLLVQLVMHHPRPALVIVQTPPAIPTLGVVRVACAITRSTLVIDWHNLGYTLLALKLGARSPLVTVARTLERWLGARADVHLFVTEAMRTQLLAQWRLSGRTAVLHDRPPAHFHRLSPPERDAFLARHPSFVAGCASKLVVSSTSWTPDEDIGMLIEAAALYEARARRDAAVPPICIVITGSGPLREAHERAIALRAQREVWSHVTIRTAWLATDDYPRLLGVADVGVSLHTSSSGIDLPMKVVDMLGCGLPVCALSFACLPELIEPGVNGAVFSTADELAVRLLDLLTGRLQLPHTGFVGTDALTWQAQWTRTVAPLLPP
ncbi:chitobiosyldiphosphodolichol beta-mannosyltransferase [Malassezia equina]|uniref:Chitobiosyldiphosphodolichol beta-mannosyltransferase n=1 Tax=Malassezia equina TaxID=1381935 RepID=A0AAF0ECW5_9BASI|nr:chitobiosyldiphosphodolichol beta-mannosyltransferase [Malassezia equina]